MQEGIFWTLKVGTDKRYQGLHQLPDYINKQWRKRANERQRKIASDSAQWNQTATLQSLAFAGVDDLIGKCSEYLTEVGFRMMLQQLNIGATGYDVMQVDRHQAMTLCKTIINERSQRAASTMHLLCLIEEVSHLSNRYFQLRAKSGKENAFDVVLVADNGSFACSDPHFAQYGMPSRHVFAVFAAQYCAINPLLHFHPCYIRNISNPAEGSKRNPCEIANLTWPEKFQATALASQTRAGYVRPAITRQTSWSWAIGKVIQRATETVLGGTDEAAAVLRPDPRQIREAPEAKEDRKRKALIQIGKSLTVKEVESIAANAKSSKKTPTPFQDPSGSGFMIAQQPKQAERKRKRHKSALEKARRSSNTKVF
jgi:hypothetical protein